MNKNVEQSAAQGAKDTAGTVVEMASAREPPAPAAEQSAQPPRPRGRRLLGWTMLILGGALGVLATLYLVIPAQEFMHRRELGRDLSAILASTPTRIEVSEKEVPEWLEDDLEPEWYLEAAAYAEPVRAIEETARLIRRLRRYKAIVDKEATPAFSNDKIENRLRDGRDKLFGGDYETRRRLFIDSVLAILALTDERSAVLSRVSVFEDEARNRLLDEILVPRPPEPNEHYDSRVDQLIDVVQKPLTQLEDDEPVLVTSAERRGLVDALDRLYVRLDDRQRRVLLEGGLARLIELEPEVVTDATTRFRNAVRERFLADNVLEVRLLMLDVLYKSRLFGERDRPSDVYVFHLAGRKGIQALSRVDSEAIRSAASGHVGDIVSEGMGYDAGRAEFLIRMLETQAVKRKKPKDPEFALGMLYDRLRFEEMLDRVREHEDQLRVLPFIGTLGLPVEEFDVSRIRPWGLFRARRDGGRTHRGVDIAGEMGEPVLAVQDGVVNKASYDARGYGNYIVATHSGLRVTYAHLLRVPTDNDYERMLTAQERRTYAGDEEQGYLRARRRFASIMTGRAMGEIELAELEPENLTELSRFEQIRQRLRKGEKILVRKGEVIGHVGMSGNVQLNSGNPRMVYPHVHLEVNDGRLDPMSTFKELKRAWPTLRRDHLNGRDHAEWVRANWWWYRRLYTERG